MFVNDYNPLAWIRGIDKGHVTIGNSVWIGPFTVVDGEYDTVEIGDGTNVSSGAQIITHDTVKRCLTDRKLDIIEHAPTKIGKNVYIGTNAVVLKGCIIGDCCIIAAGAVVKENSIIPAYSLVVGVPAVIKKSIQEDYQHWIEKYEADSV